MKILLVEDSRSMTARMASRLAAFGPNVIIALANNAPPKKRFCETDTHLDQAKEWGQNGVVLQST